MKLLLFVYCNVNIKMTLDNTNEQEGGLLIFTFLILFIEIGQTNVQYKRGVIT